MGVCFSLAPLDVAHVDTSWRLNHRGCPDGLASRGELRPPATIVRRRAFGAAVLHAPQTLRALVRADEIWLVVLSAFVGCGAGIAVWLMTATTQLIHQVLFGIGAGQRLSAMVELDPIRTVAVPCARRTAARPARPCASCATTRAARSIRSRPTRCTAGACR